MTASSTPAHTVDNNGRALARWYQVDVGDWPNGPAPTLEQTGDIDLGPGQNTFFPSIYSNANGNVAVVYANCSPTELVSVKASGRLASDPVGTLGTPVEFANSSVSVSGRYGDYFDIAIDPLDDRTFWTVGETSESFGWDTVINSFVVETDADSCGRFLRRNPRKSCFWNDYRTGTERRFGCRNPTRIV